MALLKVRVCLSCKESYSAQRKRDSLHLISLPRWRCWCFKPFRCLTSRRFHVSFGRRRDLLGLHASPGSQLHHVLGERRGERRGGDALGERGGGGQREDLELWPGFDSPRVFIDTAVFHKNPVIVYNVHPSQSAQNSIACDPLGPSATPIFNPLSPITLY
ncbi:hypothetical protein Taro_013356 [Colocasia esculenta]|uniref:Uncharacterized protein n=1 Tax=Colocasia esculenta TaxID=4460 RepID=A0A843UG72_COLES|nr:hypothetical protein [Colocasia esculenta]